MNELNWNSLFFFQSWSSVYSEPESSSGSWAYECKPLSSCKYFNKQTIVCCFLCLHFTICRTINTLFTIHSWGHYKVLTLSSSPPFAAKSFPTDQPWSILKPLRQTQRLPLPQGDRQGQLRQGPAGTPSRWWPVLRSQSLTEKGHPQEEGGKCGYRHAKSAHAYSLSTSLTLYPLLFYSPGETHHVREECAAKECQAPFLGGSALLFPNNGQTLLHLGLHQWRRGEKNTKQRW